MVNVYALLIIKKVKTIDEVPEKIRDAVRAELINRGFADLAGDND